MKLYIAGPMTGLPNDNFPTFHRVADRLRSAGHMVFNPAENYGGRVDLPREQYMRQDFAAILQCDGLVLLDGWKDSNGAQAEVIMARAIGLSLYNESMEVQR